MRRVSSRRSRRWGFRSARVPCRSDVSARLGVAVTRAVRGARPDLLHTHLVHGDVYGSIAATALRVPLVSSRHNDDRYLLGPFRYVDRAFARPARRIIAISDAVRRFLEQAGLPAPQAGHDPLRPRRAACRAVGDTAGGDRACPRPHR